MIVRRKLAAHQIGVGWSLPAQTMQERGEGELSGKGTKLLVKKHLPSVDGGLANTSGSGVCAPGPLIQEGSCLGGVQVHMTVIETLVILCVVIFFSNTATEKQKHPS